MSQLDETGPTRYEVTQAVSHVTDIMNEIAAVSTERSKALNRSIKHSISQMDEVPQQNAALIEKAAAAANSLEDQARKLNQFVALFRFES